MPAETKEQFRGLGIARQLDQRLLLPDAKGDVEHGEGGQRIAAAGGALLDLGGLVGFLGGLALLVPDLLDGRNDDLERLQRLDRFLVEAKDEQLPPVLDLDRVALEFTRDVLGSLRGKIHKVRRISLRQVGVYCKRGGSGRPDLVIGIHWICRRITLRGSHFPTRIWSRYGLVFFLARDLIKDFNLRSRCKRHQII